MYGDLYNDEWSSSIPINKSEATSVWGGEIKIEKEPEKRKNDFLRHLEAEDCSLESVRKKQKPEKSCRLLEDQDKDICDCEEESITTVNQSYEQYKKIYDLDRQVNAWSDYLSARFHPRTNVVVEDYLHNDLRTRPFDIYGLGLNHETLAENIEDQIRYFAEEADYLRGFHLVVDAYNSFGGVSVKVAQLLADEYASKVILRLR